MLFSSPACEYLIVGLGNPGKKYDNTRHNIGFSAMDSLSKSLGVTVNRAKFSALSCLCTVKGKKVLLLSPQTYMNLSGQAVKAAAEFYKIPPQRIIVIYDDISLPVGRMRIRGTGSAGGHNGIKSIIASLGTQDFPRVKIGVGEKPTPEYDLADWVLSRFSSQEKKVVEKMVVHGANASMALCTDPLDVVVSAYNAIKE